jgi:hypothetical protein
MTMTPGMGARDLKIWAREEIMDAIDEMLVVLHDKDGTLINFEDELVLKKERDRVAKFLNLPTKY